MANVKPENKLRDDVDIAHAFKRAGLSFRWLSWFHKQAQSTEELLAAIGDLLSGRMYVPRWLADDAETRDIPVAQCDMPETHSPTERDPPDAGAGMSNKEIAKHLEIAPGTAKIHTAALLHALHAHNRTEAAFIAAKILGPAAFRTRPQCRACTRASAFAELS